MSASRLTAALVAVARPAAIFFAAVSALGFLWFLGAHRPLDTAYFVTTVVALLTFAALPRRAFDKGAVRVLVVAAAVAALGTTVAEAQGDVTLVNGADYPALVLRGVEALIFVVMGLEAIARPVQRPPG